MSETKGSKFSIRDVITVAAMLVINYMIAMVVSAVTLPFSEVYLYPDNTLDYAECEAGTVMSVMNLLF